MPYEPRQPRHQVLRRGRRYQMRIKAVRLNSLVKSNLKRTPGWVTAALEERACGGKGDGGIGVCAQRLSTSPHWHKMLWRKVAGLDRTYGRR